MSDKREAGECEDEAEAQTKLTDWKGSYWSTASRLELVTWVTEGS